MLPETCECRVMPCVAAEVPDLLPLALQALALALKSLLPGGSFGKMVQMGNGSESSQ